LSAFPGGFGFYQGGAGALSALGNGGFGGGGTGNDYGSCYLKGGAGNFRSFVFFICLAVVYLSIFIIACKHVRLRFFLTEYHYQVAATLEEVELKQALLTATIMATARALSMAEPHRIMVRAPGRAMASFKSS
jgi:hypothetical protein